jgi:hypothetical protein
VIARVPLASAEVAQTAEPAARATLPQPLIVTPSERKLIVPVGVPKLPVTVAVKLTL